MEFHLNILIISASVLAILRLGTLSHVSSEYLGASLGKLSSYSNQISGDVYVIDHSTFLIKNFFYDGQSQDAFFWAGSSLRPSNKGFIVPSEDGRTNRLQKYTNRDITIQLPDDRRISSIRWLAIWDVRSGKNLADVLIGDDFEAPSAKKISDLSGSSNGIKSQTVILLNSRTIFIESLYFDGLSSSSFFMVGIGPQPSGSGTKVPDETGALEPLGAYDGQSIVLELPGNLTIFDIDWLSIYDTQINESIGSVAIPSHLSVPPALVSMLRHESRLPQCEQLHRDIQLNWDVFGPQITFELVARIAPNDYIAFGISGSETSASMIGADVSISHLDQHFGFTRDYNISDKHPCVALRPGDSRGVCADSKLKGAFDNYQIHSFSRENGLTRITFRRNLLNSDENDKPFKTSGKTSIVWAVGRLNKYKEPAYHHLYSKGLLLIEFGRKLSKNCFNFAISSMDTMLNANDATLTRRQAAALAPGNRQMASQSPQQLGRNSYSALSFLSSLSSGLNKKKTKQIGFGNSINSVSGNANANSAIPGSSGSADDDEPALAALAATAASWGQAEVQNKTASVFHARLGHPGAYKGYLAASDQSSPGLVWYINGLMAPILHVQRGRTYTFRIEAGNLENNYRFYHPFYITDEQNGGYVHQNLTEKTQQKVFAGLQFERVNQEETDDNKSGEANSREAKIRSKLNKPHIYQPVKMIGKPTPQSVGRLCSWLPNNSNDLRRADSFESFAQFRAKLNYTCGQGLPGIIQWTPNVSTPDVVYYQSYTQRNMGWKIIVRDEAEVGED